jgi:glucans biosynthesis protein
MGVVVCACTAVIAAAQAIPPTTTAAAAAPPAANAATRDNGTPFNRDALLSEAQRLSREPFEKAMPQGLGALGELSYDQYRDIRFQRGASIWEREGRGFTVDLFHPGFIYKAPIQIDLVVGGRARPVRFTPEVFDYGPTVKRPDHDGALGYSGFRVRYAINSPDVLDEFLLFQGASYFRAVGRGQIYGLSARGLAVKTGDEEGEEFPAFRRFWIERPPVGATSLVIHALLDSPSVTGAYTFTITPGDDTRMDVQCALFPRVKLESFGIAPLTSMFLLDASNRARFDDFRDAVHDSDGLQMLSGAGERIWRPLANPRKLQLSLFMDSDPQGFGLGQRKRSYADYGDAEAHYELRPSLWIEPQEKWGRGAVELVEIPSEKETHDNIVAFWRPAQALEAGGRYDYRYRLHWLATPPDKLVARVVSTRIGRAVDGDRRLIVVDFDRAGAGVPGLRALVAASAGEVSRVNTQPITATKQYRASFELDTKGEDLIELRLMLLSGDKPWSETWLYRWTR